MKKIFSILIACAISISSLFACAPTKTEEKPVLSWEGYSETANAYVYDFYSFMLPVVTDQLGREYDVTATVTDPQGQEVDSFGNSFLIAAEEEYEIEFSAFDGTESHTKTTTVTGVMKTTYSLSSSQLIYEQWEEIDLNGKVLSTEDGDISYVVRKNGSKITLEDNKFTATEKGLYDVTAKVVDQPEYSFRLFVIGENEYEYPNGLITDRADASGISIKVVHDEPEIPLTGGATVSFDPTQGFEEDSNGSTKISVNYPEGSGHFTTDIFYKPEFPKEYYEALKTTGYKNIAVRMRIVEGEDTIDYYGAYFGGLVTHSIINKNGQEVFSDNQVAVWSGPGWEFGRTYGWIELLLPIDHFLQAYAEEILLFSFTGSNSPTSLSYGSVDILIDNIYAVKAIGGKSSFEETELNVKLEFKNVNFNDMSDVDGRLIAVNLNGNPLDVEEEIVYSEQGLYTSEFRARNRFGVIRLERATFDTKGIVSTLTSAGVTAGVPKNPGDPDGVYMAEISYDKNMSYCDDKGSVKIKFKSKNRYTDISFNPLHGKEYYENLYAEGYEYVTVRMYTQDTCLYVQEGGVWPSHYNTIPDKEGEAPKPRNVWIWWKNTELLPIYSIGTWGRVKNEQMVGWLEVSIKMEYFLNNFDEDSTKILRIWNMFFDEQTVWIDGVYATKEGHIDPVVDYDVTTPDVDWENA